MRNLNTALELISSKGTVISGAIVYVKGYSTAGDGGEASWKFNGVTGQTPSQSPSQLGGALINDASGNQWELVPIMAGVKPIIKIDQLGAGSEDDSSVFVAALNGFHVVLSNRVYRASGIDSASSSTWSGSGSETEIRYNDSGSAAYIFKSNSGILEVEDIHFNYNNTPTAGNCVLVNNGSVNAVRCEFSNATAQSGLGEGLYLFGSNTKGSVEFCKFRDNGSHGLSVAQSPGLDVLNSSSYNNGGSGFYFNNYDPSLTKNIDSLKVSNCSSTDNAVSGYIFGNPFNDNDFNGDDFGFDNNVCTNVEASNLGAVGNQNYGFVLSMVHGNVDSPYARFNTFGGVLINGRFIDVSNPTVTNNPSWGIDIGQGSDISITGGRVAFNSTVDSTALLVEAAQNVLLDGISVYGNGNVDKPQIIINAWGGTGDGRFFPRKTSGVVCRCDVRLDAQRKGIQVNDNPSRILDENTYVGDYIADCTRYAILGSELLIGKAKMLKAALLNNTGGSVVFADLVTQLDMNSTTDVYDVRPYSYDLFIDKVAYCSVSAVGSGYTLATVTISGDGSGATADAMINAGKVVGIRMTNFGSGYTSATVSISGDGSGATADATVGVKLPEDKEILLTFNQNQTVVRSGKPFINSPSGSDISASIRGSMSLSSRFGDWIVSSSTFTV